MSRIFLSYSSEDGTAALRLYDDLLHSGLRPWRYEADSRIGVAFDQEFVDELARSQVVCLLDSAAARRSPYVRQECEACLRLGSTSSGPRLIICTIEPRGRPDEPGWWREEIFAAQNKQTFVDLTDYDNGVRLLCRELGVAYVPRFTLPRDRELEAELIATRLGPRVTQELIDAYSAFRCRYAEDPQTAKGYLLVTIGRCRELGARDVVSPRLASGVMAADSGDHRIAMEIFRDLCTSHPDDARGWMGLGGALYYLEQVEAALEAYQRCQQVMAPPVDEVERLREIELTHNTARCLAVLGRLREARERLTNLPQVAQRQPVILALIGSLELTERRPEQARMALEAALDGFGGKPPLSLVLDLADCYHQLGLVLEERGVIEHALMRSDLSAKSDLHRRAASLYDRLGDPTSVIGALRRAAELEHPDLVGHVELASYLWQLGDHEGARKEAQSSLAGDLTPRQRYYRGLALHLTGRRSEAAEEEAQSRGQSPVVGGWPSYEQVLAG